METSLDKMLNEGDVPVDRDIFNWQLEFLGLLGTIMGLIAAFTAVANANPAEKADLLSASISVAMNTTAFGLMSAIPLLLFHAKLTSTTGQIVDSLEMAMIKAVNCISDFNRRHFEKESESVDEEYQDSNPESEPEQELVKSGHINDPATSKKRRK